MSKEEIIKNIKEMIQWSDNNTYKMALQGLLDLYQKEKEKNKELEERLEIKKNTPEWEYQYWEARKEVYEEWRCKIKELAKKYEYASVGYDSSTADYKQSQDIGRYIAYVELLKGE